MRYHYILPIILFLIAETSDSMNDAINSTMLIVTSVIPVLVMILILRLLFTSFRDISKTDYVKLNIAKILPILIVLGQTDTWSTDMDIWSTITGIVLLVLPFLVLLIVLRSIFRYFTREW